MTHNSVSLHFFIFGEKMTELDFCQLIERIRYKPNFSLEVEACFDEHRWGDRREGVYVHLHARVLNVRYPEETTTVSSTKFFSRHEIRHYYCEEVAVQALVQFVKEMEIHEMQEWFTVDNVQVLAPHGEMTKLPDRDSVLQKARKSVTTYFPQIPRPDFSRFADLVAADMRDDFASRIFGCFKGIPFPGKDKSK